MLLSLPVNNALTLTFFFFFFKGHLLYLSVTEGTGGTENWMSNCHLNENIVQPHVQRSPLLPSPDQCSLVWSFAVTYACLFKRGFFFFHLNVKFHMLHVGMYSPVILPAVPNCTLVNHTNHIAIAQRQKKEMDRNKNDTRRALSEKVLHCAVALDWIISFRCVCSMFCHLIIKIRIIYTNHIQDIHML